VARSTLGPGWVLGAEDVARRTVARAASPFRPLLMSRGRAQASLGACVARTPATLHFVAVREVTALERDDPRAALALYKVVASVNTAIANRCKMALGRMADAAFDNLG
jgi:hypothetical protein